MRNRKRRMENFTFYDYREICTHLEQMVQKGGDAQKDWAVLGV